MRVVMITVMFVLIIAAPLHSVDPPPPPVPVYGQHMEESDNYYDCLYFPCYTAEWKEWVSMKYLTRKLK